MTLKKKNAFININSKMLVEKNYKEDHILIVTEQLKKTWYLSIPLYITDHWVETLHFVQLLKLWQEEVSLQLHHLDHDHHIPLECLDLWLQHP